MDEPAKVIAALTIVRYPRHYIPFALFAMAVHRIPLFFNRRILFWKLLGCGKGGGFSKTPDWRQWGILIVRDCESLHHTHIAGLKDLYGDFITGWYKFWKCELTTFFLEPISGHGTWDSKAAFGILPHAIECEGRIAVLTRATIRLNKLSRFWAHVDDTSALLQNATGLEYSVSIGEIPFIKQATFSIWHRMEDMKKFAYATQHATVIEKTRTEKWYKEELFVRFKVLSEFKSDAI